MTPQDDRPEKKSETLEVRLPHSVKRKFMRATRKQGETASDAVRRFINDYVAEAEASDTPTFIQDMTMTFARNKKKSLAMIASSALAAVAFTAMPSAADDAVFDRLDKNKDGVLIVGEISENNDAEVIALLDTDKSGSVSREEFKTKATGIILDDSSAADGATTVTIKKIDMEIQDGGDKLYSAIMEATADAMPNATEEELADLRAKLRAALDKESFPKH